MVKKFGLIKNTKYLLAVLSLTSAFYGKAGAQTTEEDYQQGLKYLVAGNVQESVRLFKKALQLKKKFWEAYQSLGNAYEKLGLMDDALDNYNKSLKLNPQNETLQLLASGLKADQESILPDKGVRFIPPIKPDSKLEVNLFYSFPGWLGTPADANVWNQTMGFGLWIGYALDGGSSWEPGLIITFTALIPWRLSANMEMTTSAAPLLREAVPSKLKRYSIPQGQYRYRARPLPALCLRRNGDYE